VALSADGNTAVVGGPLDNWGIGAAWVFTRTGVSWTQQVKLVGSNNYGNAQQGTSVALSGDGNTAILGGPADNRNTGAAWVFARNGEAWSELKKLVGTGAWGLAQQGLSVALSGDGQTAAVGGPHDNGNTGAVWIFTRGGTFPQQGPKLIGYSPGAVGAASQGASVALSGDGNTVIIGAPGYNNINTYYTGGAWVFTRTGAVWTQQGPEHVGGGIAIGGAGDPNVGWSVSLSSDGNIAIVGGLLDSTFGAAWIFARNTGGAATYNGVWVQQGPKLAGSNASMNAEQGVSVALSGDGHTAIVGGPNDNGRTGAAWVFLW
jgi:hypothetical protein